MGFQTGSALARTGATFIGEGDAAAAERGFPMQKRLVRSGLITAEAEFTDMGVIIHAPLCFDEEIVAETGSWGYLLDPSDEAAIADALTDTYSALHADWCARKDAERAAAAVPATTRRMVSTVPAHTPCPVLWAGR